MDRRLQENLTEWLRSPHRKPLVLRGARQVGKSTLVRLFAAQENLELVELNFERDPELAAVFQSRDPHWIVNQLRLLRNATLQPGRSLLFLDELQACPAAFVALRYFHEELSALPVVAAGSLLEFALSDARLSVPVGRVEYRFLGPMDFREFLQACGEGALAAHLATWTLPAGMPSAIHERLRVLFRQYTLVGGMPESVLRWSETRDASLCERTKTAILLTYEDDFAKYTAGAGQRRVRQVFRWLPGGLGRKVVFSEIDGGERADVLNEALEQLCRAQVATRVVHSAGNGVPLAAEENRKHGKVVFLDTGLVCTAQQLGPTLVGTPDVMQINAGAIAEQIAGQMLRESAGFDTPPSLHYWTRDKAGASAELDYLIAVAGRVVPIEVKAGATGRLRSLHVFMNEKGLDLAVRLYDGPPEMTSVDLGFNETRVRYRLLSLPLYLAGEVRRLVAREPGTAD